MATRKKAPGRSDRTGVTLVELIRMFPDNATAEAWFAAQRWPDGPRCPREGCGSANVQVGTTHKTMPYRCRTCRRFFSVRVGTVMQDSKLGYQTWAIGVYLMTTGIKGTSSMKLHRDLGVTQKTAWHLAHRIRETWRNTDIFDRFNGPVEVDETWIGGKARSRHRSRNADPLLDLQYPVAGIVDHDSGKVAAMPIHDLKAATLVGFIKDRTVPGAVVCTDEGPGYMPLARMGYQHHTVNHTKGEYVGSDGATTNSIESLWALLKRGYVGTYHHMSRQHLHRYVTEFTGRHNDRPLDTADQMQRMARHMDGRLLTYAKLVGKPPTVAELDQAEPW